MPERKLRVEAHEDLQFGCDTLVRYRPLWLDEEVERRPVHRFPDLAHTMVHEAHEAETAPRRGPLQHLVVAVGVAKSEPRPPANKLVEAQGLALFVVDEVDLR